MTLASTLIDLMVKNNLQTECWQEMIQTVEQIALDNKMSAQLNFPLEVLSKSNLSAGAQRNFDNLMRIFKRTETGAKPNFAGQIETQLHTVQLETLFYQTKIDEQNLKIEEVYKKKWNQRLTLRDTLQNIHDVSVKQQARELSLQSLKIQQETRQKLSNLRDAQCEANHAEAQVQDNQEQLEMAIVELSTLAGQ